MHTLGRFVNASRSLQGDIVISFSIEDGETVLEDLDSLKDTDLVIDVEKFREKRSLNANRYFWKLCNEMAIKLNTTKEAIYLMMLRRYGSWQDIRIVQGEEIIRAAFRYVEDITEEYEADYKDLRCYKGSSQYDTYEMTVLINGTVSDANDIGIQTWSQEEIDNLIKNWKGEA